MISYMADGKSANFYTFKHWREAPIFYTIKLPLRPNVEKSYYQTFVQTRTKKVILSNFAAEGGKKKIALFFQNQRFAHTYIVKIS